MTGRLISSQSSLTGGIRVEWDSMVIIKWFDAHLVKECSRYSHFTMY